jgi:hypothetical protein
MVTVVWFVTQLCCCFNTLTQHSPHGIPIELLCIQVVGWPVTCCLLRFLPHFAMNELLSAMCRDCLLNRLLLLLLLLLPCPAADDRA